MLQFRGCHRGIFAGNSSRRRSRIMNSVVWCQVCESIQKNKSWRKKPFGNKLASNGQQRIPDLSCICIFAIRREFARGRRGLSFYVFVSLFHVRIPLQPEFTIIYIKRRGGRLCKCHVTYSESIKYFKTKKTHDRVLTPRREPIIIYYYYYYSWRNRPDIIICISVACRSCEGSKTIFV